KGSKLPRSGLVLTCFAGRTVKCATRPVLADRIPYLVGESVLMRLPGANVQTLLIARSVSFGPESAISHIRPSIATTWRRTLLLAIPVERSTSIPQTRFDSAYPRRTARSGGSIGSPSRCGALLPRHPRAACSPTWPNGQYPV